MNRKLETIYKAAERLGLSHWTVRRKCYDGVYASHKIGTRLLMDSDEVDRIIAASERPRLHKERAA